MLGSVDGRAIVRLREQVIPLLDLHGPLGHEEPGSGDGSSAVVLVVQMGERYLGLGVDRVLGRQEVVIESLEGDYAASGPICGATIRDDGSVGLILDLSKLMSMASERERVSAA